MMRAPVETRIPDSKPLTVILCGRRTGARVILVSDVWPEVRPRRSLLLLHFEFPRQTDTLCTRHKLTGNGRHVILHLVHSVQ